MLIEIDEGRDLGPTSDLVKRVGRAIPWLGKEDRGDALPAQKTTYIQRVFYEKTDASLQQDIPFGLIGARSDHFDGPGHVRQHAGHPFLYEQSDGPGSHKEQRCYGTHGGQGSAGTVYGLQVVIISAVKNAVNNGGNDIRLNVETLLQIVPGDMVILYVIDPVFLTDDTDKKPHGIGKHPIDIKSDLARADHFFRQAMPPVGFSS